MNGNDAQLSTNIITIRADVSSISRRLFSFAPSRHAFVAPSIPSRSHIRNPNTLISSVILVLRRLAPLLRHLTPLSLPHNLTLGIVPSRTLRLSHILSRPLAI